jgi:hypothetical protein
MFRLRLQDKSAKRGKYDGGDEIRMTFTGSLSATLSPMSTAGMFLAEVVSRTTG